MGPLLAIAYLRARLLLNALRREAARLRVYWGHRSAQLAQIMFTGLQSTDYCVFALTAIQRRQVRDARATLRSRTERIGETYMVPGEVVLHEARNAI